MPHYDARVSYGVGTGVPCRTSAADSAFAISSRMVSGSVGDPERPKKAKSSIKQLVGSAVEN